MDETVKRRCALCNRRYCKRGKGVDTCPECYKRRRAIAGKIPQGFYRVVGPSPSANGHTDFIEAVQGRIMDHHAIRDFIFFGDLIGAYVDCRGVRYIATETHLEALKV